MKTPTLVLSIIAIACAAPIIPHDPPAGLMSFKHWGSPHLDRANQPVGNKVHDKWANEQAWDSEEAAFSGSIDCEENHRNDQMDPCAHSIGLVQD